MIPFHWKVGDDIYYNDIAAYKAATSTNTHPEFVVSTISDGPKWRREPPESVYAYMDAVSRHIASKYERINLMYSGGTDSHTILESFIRCGIKNVNLIMYNTEEHRDDPDRMYMNNWTTDTLKSNYKSIFTELGYTFNDHTTHDSMWRSLTKDELSNAMHSYIGCWNIAIRPVYGSARYPNELKTLNHRRTAIVWGYEKPLIAIKDGWWCWYAQDSIADYLDMGPNADVDNVFFYYSDAVPELQIKLAWLRMKELAAILSEYQIPLTNQNVDFMQNPARKYIIYSRLNHACGYRGLNLKLDSAESKISPHKIRSHQNSLKASADRGHLSMMQDFKKAQLAFVDTKYYNFDADTFAGLKTRLIRLKEVT